ARELVVPVALGEARRAEDRHARPGEVEGAEAAHELEEHARGVEQLEAALLRALQEGDFTRGRGLLAPGRSGAALAVAVARGGHGAAPAGEQRHYSGALTRSRALARVVALSPR